MVVVQLGTLQGGGCLRTRMEVLQLRDDAWWKRAVIASKIISLAVCLILLILSLNQSKDVRRASDTLAIQVPAHPSLAPCADNAFYTIWSDQAPLSFSLESDVGSRVTCGWRGKYNTARIVCCVLALFAAPAAFIGIETSEKVRVFATSCMTKWRSVGSGVFSLVLGVILLRIALFDFFATTRSLEWCEDGLKGGEDGTKGVKWTKHGTAQAVACHYGAFYVTCLFDALAAVGMLAASALYALHVHRGGFDDDESVVGIGASSADYGEPDAPGADAGAEAGGVQASITSWGSSLSQGVMKKMPFG